MPPLCWAALFESRLLETEEEHLLLDPGHVLKLHCDANHSLDVAWYKEAKQLFPGGRVRIWQRTLEIAEVAYEDSGLYGCRAQDTGQSLHNFTISVVGESPGQVGPSCPTPRSTPCWESPGSAYLGTLPPTPTPQASQCSCPAPGSAPCWVWSSWVHSPKPVPCPTPKNWGWSSRELPGSRNVTPLVTLSFRLAGLR